MEEDYTYEQVCTSCHHEWDCNELKKACPVCGCTYLFGARKNFKAIDFKEESKDGN